ncbi:MAG: adenosylmethionine decarboxylase [Candidatus Methanomethylicota archaeon]|uniref:S-adenosylmethionine decarboxylase proenzyme n=1 Tax=Thermoproteota archaeon TaxID=2056631 RepID=A0A497F303_9CREN|nr:MAG: adenosylmethionine decarboxylase [Candidatus Verstraetearchaeota archaeon]
MYSQIQVGRAVGRHVYGNLYECSESILSSPEYLKEIVIKAVEVARAKLCQVCAYSVEDYVAAIAIVMESHIAIHAWPKYGYATVDVYTCGNTDAEAAFDFIVEKLKPKRFTKYSVDRSNS